MHILEQWTLEQIRNDDPMMGWLEERRFDFVPSAKTSVDQIIQGATIVLLTDHNREWYGDYILNKLNNPKNDRPILPIVKLSAIYPFLDRMTGAENNDMIEDMLSISFKDNYFFWYIGKGDDKRADIAKRSDKSMLWVLDEELQNSFLLQSFDKLLDIKLLHLYRLFDRTLGGALYGEYEL